MNAVNQLRVETEGYGLRLAASAADVARAQRLRFEVFNLELSEGLSSSVETGLDADEFDPVCDHLLVEERAGGAVVGTYRLQTGRMAAAGRGYYSAREFDFAPFEPARDRLIELGRACVAAEHRNQTVLGLLWKGIARYSQSAGARWLVGCSSLTSQDEAEGLAAYAQLAPRNLVAEPWRTSPWPALRCRAGEGEPPAVKIPRLMSSYLLLGAKICGEPAIDREFGTIDFLTLFDLEASSARVLRKYLG
ncbi:MAG: GNAT family N-acyltransferase [Verrucomicrobiota bacterium]